MPDSLGKVRRASVDLSGGWLAHFGACNLLLKYGSTAPCQDDVEDILTNFKFKLLQCSMCDLYAFQSCQVNKVLIDCCN